MYVHEMNDKKEQYRRTSRGRRAFNSREEFIEAVNSYFENGEDRVSYTKDGEKIHRKFYSISGLTLHLGFASAQSLYDYGKHGLYMDIVQEARLRIENEREYDLMHGNTNGAKFALQQLGWSEKTETKDTTQEDALRELDGA